MSPNDLRDYSRLVLLARVSPSGFGEYRKWLIIRATTPDVSPSDHIDAIWHAHILDTKHYREYCAETVGTFVDHDPTGAFDQKARMARLSNTHIRYEELFGPMSADAQKFWGVKEAQQAALARDEAYIMARNDRIAFMATQPSIGTIHYKLLGMSVKYFPIIEGTTIMDLKILAHAGCPNQLRILKTGRVLTDDSLIVQHGLADGVIELYATMVLGGC